MMSIKEFMQYIADNVKDYLPPAFENADVTVEEVHKNNDTLLHGIIIRNEDEQACPRIYLDQMYEDYKMGKDLDECVGDVADVRVEADAPELAQYMDYLKDYENAKPMLQVRLCDPEKNKEANKERVLTKCGDFVATYNLNLNQNKRGVASIPVGTAMLELWNVTKEQLHQDAMQADKMRTPTFVSVEDVVMNLTDPTYVAHNYLEDSKDTMDVEPNSLFCLSNENKFNGASYIIHEDITQKIGEMIGGDYYVLPSSIHETLIVPDTGLHDVNELEAMVKEVNETQVAPDEILSDKVQHYDSKEHILENARTFEQRKEKEKEQTKGKSIKERLSDAKKETKGKAVNAPAKQKKNELEM